MLFEASETVRVPNHIYEKMENEVAMTKLSKRKAWKSYSKSATGQKINIYYTKDPIILDSDSRVTTHFYQTAFKHTALSQSVAKSGYSIERNFKVGGIGVVPVISLDQSLLLNAINEQKEEEEREQILNSGVDNDLDMNINLLIQGAENATGNHHRNHNISIPTKAGEPCRS